MCIVALVFRTRGGYMNDAKWDSEHENMRDMIAAEGLTAQDNDFYMAGYDAPYK